MVYVICGWTIVGSIISIGVFSLAPIIREALGDFPTIFILETLAIEAFGLSWLTKGQTLWPDRENSSVGSAYSLTSSETAQRL